MRTVTKNSTARTPAPIVPKEGSAGHDSRRDQATRLRELARRRGHQAQVLSIVSGKGGVGKSNLAVNLALCLSSRGLRVTLVDVDMGLANADLLMNLRPRYTLAHVVAGVRSVDEVVVDGPGGLRFVPGASGTHEMASLSKFELDNLITQLGKLQRSADIVVLDGGAGLSRSVMSFALASDRSIIVTTPEPTSMTDAYATVKALYRDGGMRRMSLFVNKANSRAEAGEVFQRIAGVAQRFLNYSIADGGYMLHDSTVELAVQQRCPFVIGHPRSNASACVAALATDIARSVEGQRSRSGLFRRVAGLFV